METSTAAGSAPNNSATLFVFLGAPAAAADLPIEMHGPIYRPPVAAVARHVWTGCYFGANAGALLVRNDITFGSPTYPGSPPLGLSLGGHNAGGGLAGIQMAATTRPGIGWPAHWEDSTGRTP